MENSAPHSAINPAEPRPTGPHPITRTFFSFKPPANTSSAAAKPLPVAREFSEVLRDFKLKAAKVLSSASIKISDFFSNASLIPAISVFSVIKDLKPV